MILINEGEEVNFSNTVSMPISSSMVEEQTLREQIAQEIGEYMNNYFDDFSAAITPVLVAIARGKSK